MRVHLPRIDTGPYVDIPVDEFEALAAGDRFREHYLVAEPEEADLILFSQCHMVDWRLRSIVEHPVAQSHWNKVMVYDERDRPWRSLPGVYVSMPRSSLDLRSQRSWGYFRLPDPVETSGHPDLLFSLVGSPSHPCRTPLFGLRHPEGVVEEVRDFMFWDASSPDYEARRARFKAVLARSRFVLCPRGRGTSSFRIYQALAAGRVPVIISDEWAAPLGPDWEKICIRWPERRARGLVELLKERDADWPEMSLAAREAHRDFFAPEVSFHRVVECCADLEQQGRLRRPARRTFRVKSLVAAAENALRSRSAADS